jgi:hypothetical protein
VQELTIAGVRARERDSLSFPEVDGEEASRRAAPKTEFFMPKIILAMVAMLRFHGTAAECFFVF